METLLEAICRRYDGEVRLLPPADPAALERAALPEALAALLARCDGIMETAVYGGEREEIGYVLYPLGEILESTAFFRETYGVEGFAFADDGTGAPYLLREDGEIWQLQPTEGEEERVAGSLGEFFGLEGGSER